MQSALPIHSLRCAQSPSPLPNELWDEILTYVERCDLKRIRLAGPSHLAALASKQLFRTAYVAAREGVFETFVEMLSHLTIRGYVTEVVFDSSCLDANIVHGPNGLPVEGAYEDVELARIFSAQEIIQTSKMRAALELAFSYGMCVGKVTFADLSRKAFLPGDHTIDTSTDALDWHNAQIRRRKPNEVSKFVCADCLAEAETCSQHLNSFRRQFGGLLALLDVLADADTTSLRKLSLGDTVLAGAEDMARDRLAGIPNFSFHHSTKSCLSLQQIAPSLRVLDISLCFPESAEASDQEPQAFPPKRNLCGRSTADCDWQGFRTFLGLATNLEELKLRGECNVANLHLDSIWPPADAMPNLRVLDLRFVEAHYETLVDFLRAHEGKLRQVRLEDFNLLSGRWRALAQFVRDELRSLSLILGFVYRTGNSRYLKFKELIEDSATDWLDDEFMDAAASDGSSRGAGDEQEGGHEEESEDSLEYESDDSSTRYPVFAKKVENDYQRRHVLMEGLMQVDGLPLP